MYTARAKPVRANFTKRETGDLSHVPAKETACSELRADIRERSEKVLSVKGP